MLGSSPRSLIVFEEDFVFLSSFPPPPFPFSFLPASHPPLYYLHKCRRASRILWSSQSLGGHTTELQAAYFWFGVKYLLLLNIALSCLLRSGFNRGQDQSYLNRGHVGNVIPVLLESKGLFGKKMFFKRFLKTCKTWMRKKLERGHNRTCLVSQRKEKWVCRHLF